MRNWLRQIILQRHAAVSVLYNVYPTNERTQKINLVGYCRRAIINTEFSGYGANHHASNTILSSAAQIHSEIYKQKPPTPADNGFCRCIFSRRGRQWYCVMAADDCVAKVAVNKRRFQRTCSLRNRAVSSGELD